MKRSQQRFLFLNVGHFLDHFFVLIFATVAALRLSSEWQMTYAELIPYATPGIIAFGLFAVPAGWLADKWSREGMLVVFFIGIGLSSVFTSYAESPLQIAIGLTLIGTFAAIYHPVGLAMVVQGRDKLGLPLAINGVSGNMGVASAALLTGLLIDSTGWKSAFALPGYVSVAVGIAYWLFESRGQRLASAQRSHSVEEDNVQKLPRRTLIRVFSVILLASAIGGMIFQSTTFSLPKVFDERLMELADTATLVGFYTFAVFAVAAFAQIVVGYLIDNHSIRTVFACIAILQVVFFALMTQVTGVAALFVAFGFMLVVFGELPIVDTLVGRVAHSEWRSRAFSLSYIISFTVSAAAVPIIAWIHGSWGFDRLFALLALLAALIFVAVLFLPKAELAPRHKTAPI